MPTLIPGASSFEAEEDSTAVTFDSYMMNSSSSASSSPIYIDPNQSQTQPNQYPRPPGHVIQQSPLLVKARKITPPRPATIKSPLLPILSEYESVSDAILLGMERSGSEKGTGFCGGSKETEDGVDKSASAECDHFEVTISECNNLTDRCNEIIGMFGELKHQRSETKSPTFGN